MKKKAHYFEIHISRVLKQCSESKSISLIAKQQLNSFVCIFISRLCHDVIKLLNTMDRKVCTVTDIETILKLLLHGQLRIHCIEQGQKSLESLKNITPETRINRNTKANIIFAPSLVERLMRKNNVSFTHKNDVSVFIASVCEFIVYEILDTTVLNISKKKIDVIDLQTAVDKDEELSQLFRKMNTSFFDENKHNYLCKSSFLRLVKKCGETSDMKISKVSAEIMRTYVEDYVIGLMKMADKLCEYNGRHKILPSDFEMVREIMERNNNKTKQNLNDDSQTLLSL